MGLRTGLKWFIYAEIAAVAGTYILWHRMNTEQEFRRYMYHKHPRILEGFYKAAEFGGYTEGRKMDYKAWGVSSEASTSSSK